MSDIEIKEILMFNMYTGEMISVPILKGSWDTRFGFELDATTLGDVLNYLPICLGFIPRYDIEGNYMGYTDGDSDNIFLPIYPHKFRLTTIEKPSDEKIKTGMRNFKLIGVTAVILIAITLLDIYYIGLDHVINGGFLAIQFVILIVAIINFMKLQKWKKEFKGVA